MQKFIATCLLAFASIALPAQVTYHDLVPDVVVGKDHLASWTGIPGFTVSFEHGTMGGGGGGSTSWDIVMFKPSGNGQVLYSDASANNVKVLSIGDSLGPLSGNWDWNLGQYWGGALAFDNFSGAAPQPYYCRYAGFRSVSAGDTLYGWLAYEKDTVGATKVTLKSWAISTLPGQPLVIQDNCLVGTEDGQSTPLTLRIYPNPTNSRLSIALDGLRGSAWLRLMDLTGRVLREQVHSPQGPSEMDVQALPAGTYLLQVESGSERLTRQVVIAR